MVRTGPHVLGGIEIYKGKPIFYSLGSLFFDFRGKRSYTTPTGQVMSFPDGYFQTVIPVTRYAKWQGRRDPALSLRHRGRWRSGRRHAASRLGGRSAPDSGGSPEHVRRYGTRISIENGIGVIRNNGA